MQRDKVVTIKKTMPLIPTRGLTVFPHMVVHFDVGRDKSISALEEAMANDSLVFLTAQKELKVDIPTSEDFYHIGTVCRIKQMLKMPGDNVRVLVEGINRGRVLNVSKEEPYFEVEIEELKYENEKDDIEIEAIMRLMLDAFEEYISIEKKIEPDVLKMLVEIDEPGRLADIIAAYIRLKSEDKQKILDAFEPYERLQVLYVVLKEEMEVLKIESDIRGKLKDQVVKTQKEYFLREQVKVIQKELGEDSEIEEEIEEYIKKIKKLKISKEIKEKSLKEANRLFKLPLASSETDTVRKYLDWIINLPWNKQTKDRLDIKESRKILDREHYGLEDVKERILEYLAVRQLSKNMKGPILCLVGPPGVGKTSIAKSIANAVDKKFVRMSLGGLRDEAEIRGHRRTYVGAMPGRIISSIKKVGSKNPVFLLDEMDKLAGDFRGDPAAALLEVLDPEQNNTFTDNFLEAPFDLSKVMFIVTANTTATIPRPLLDRMEIIRVSGYTEDEKVEIATRYLVPRQLKENGLKDSNVKLSQNVIRDVITKYTRESGVRNLERNIATIFRKVAMRIVEEEIDVVRINSGNLSKYLGIPKFKYDMASEEHQVGIVTGLAWTSVGGETLSIEVTPMKGKGKIQLTGKLGDVMKESAMTAISYIRSKAEELGIESDFSEKKDIHIHVPEGAVPKDGPSAGISMATAVISALTNIPVNKNVAMTGEITLRGRVLPIGGLKEKALAADRAGMTKVLIPFDNKKDLKDIPNKVIKKIEFVPVKNMDEVLKHALVKKENNDDN